MDALIAYSSQSQCSASDVPSADVHSPWGVGFGISNDLSSL